MGTPLLYEVLIGEHALSYKIGACPVFKSCIRVLFSLLYPSCFTRCYNWRNV